MTTNPTTDAATTPAQPETFRCETGQSARLREADSVAMDRAWTIRAHDDDRFAITPYTRPAWLRQGVMVDVEIRHPGGREHFTTPVAEIRDDEGGTTWVWFEQPPETDHIDLRRAPRADLSAEITWATLDPDRRPGDDREAELTSLSATGMRMRLNDRPLPERHGLIVCSLHLHVARVNVVGRVVGVAGDSDTMAGDARIDFRDVTDETRRLLDAEVARHLDLPVDLRPPEPIAPWSREHLLALARTTYRSTDRWVR